MSIDVMVAKLREAFHTEIPIPEDWHADAKCKGSKLPGWFEEDIKKPSAIIQLMCDSCPVKIKCMATGLKYPRLAGVWGGTTEFQRTQMRRKHARKLCVLCQSVSIVVVNEVRAQICLSCGASWQY